MNLRFSNPAPGQGEPGADHDVRPMVAIRGRPPPAWWFAGGALGAAVLLFFALEARRQGSEQARSQLDAATSLASPESIPDLVVPDSPAEHSTALAGALGWPQPGDGRQREVASSLPQPQVAARQSAYQPQPDSTEIPYLPPQDAAVYEPPALERPEQTSAARPVESAARIMAGRLENPATTVVQGTLINAVLETALDSTRPGLARALVTRDVFGFDGTRLLIPRGTRLYGTYEADIAQGQRRAQIRWTRMLRPDGVSVALDSPAADPLGRAGIEGKVNSHFLQRLGNALIGTTANVGSALVTRSVTPSSPVVVAVPGTTQGVSQTVTPGSTQIRPTLTVRQGTRITVFVQHDLDFTPVESPL